MGVKRYIVVDSLGNYLKSFTTYQQALTYKLYIGGINNYKIIEK